MRWCLPAAHFDSSSTVPRAQLLNEQFFESHDSRFIPRFVLISFALSETPFYVSLGINAAHAEMHERSLEINDCLLTQALLRVLAFVHGGDDNLSPDAAGQHHRQTRTTLRKVHSTTCGSSAFYAPNHSQLQPTLPMPHWYTPSTNGNPHPWARDTTRPILEGCTCITCQAVQL